jgi:hypothetical protein
MKPIPCRHALLLALLFGATQAQAQEQPGTPSPWSFTGYGTLGYSHENRADLDFVRDLSQRDKPPRSGTWLTDSRVGLQVAYRFSPQTDAVVQAVIRDKDRATVGNSIEWAYLSHRLTPELNVRLGRVGIDVFLLSDYRHLGYAQTTVRPNWDFYGFLPIYSLDGADATYTLNTDAARWNFKAQVGRSQADVPLIVGASYHFVADNFFDLTVTREAGPWRLKAGYMTAKAANEAPLDALTGALGGIAALPLGPISDEAARLANGMRFKDARISYLALGAGYDDGTWLAQGELSRISGDRQILVQGTAAYLNIGRRFGNFTPHAGISGFRPTQAAAAAVNDWSGVGASALQAIAVRTLNSRRIDQNTFSLGLRWDFHPQAALKLQWDRIRIKQNGYGLWSPGDSNMLSGERANLVSATVDWVF